MEGICVELGNFEKFDTFTADPTAQFQENIFSQDLCNIDRKNFPEFTYVEMDKQAIETLFQLQENRTLNKKWLDYVLVVKAIKRCKE